MADALPARLTAGDSWVFDLAQTYASHPPPDWSAQIVLRPAEGGTPFQRSALDADATYRVRWSAEETALFQSGERIWALRVEHGQTGEVITLAHGRLEVEPDPFTATADGRSHAERMLAAIEATLEGRASKDADSYSIEGRSITRTPIEELRRLRAFYRAEVAAARRGGGFNVRKVRLC